MIYFQVCDNSGNVLSSNIQDFSRRNEFENNKNFSEFKRGIGVKGIYESLTNINVWMVVENDSDLLLSSKLFKKTFELYKVISLTVYNQYKRDIMAYAHMLNTIQGQMRQKIDDFADPREFHGTTYEESLSNITSIIEKSNATAADLICYIQKRIVDMRAQLLGSEIIHSGEHYEIKPVEVSLKRAILNQCTPFLEELSKKYVQIKFYFDEECKIFVDKNMFSLIMYNFFSNAVKYTKLYSEIRLHYSHEEKSLDISMISLKIEKNEITDLFKEGIRGKHAKKIAGKGIGLFVICKAIELMGKTPLYIFPAYDKQYVEGDMIFVENHFKFIL